MSVTIYGTGSTRRHICLNFTVNLGWFVAFLEHENVPCLKLIDIAVWSVPYTIPLASPCSDTFRISLFNFLNCFVCLRIIDDGSDPKISKWSILFNKCDLKWCIHLTRTFFLYFNFYLSTTVGGSESSRGHKFYGRLRLIFIVLSASKHYVKDIQLKVIVLRSTQVYSMY